MDQGSGICPRNWHYSESSTLKRHSHTLGKKSIGKRKKQRVVFTSAGTTRGRGIVVVATFFSDYEVE